MHIIIIIYALSSGLVLYNEIDSGRLSSFVVLISKAILFLFSLVGFICLMFVDDGYYMQLPPKDVRYEKVQEPLYRPISQTKPT